MYAIVKAGGRQEKVAVGDLIVVDRVPGEDGGAFRQPVAFDQQPAGGVLPLLDEIPPQRHGPRDSGPDTAQRDPTLGCAVRYAPK